MSRDIFACLYVETDDRKKDRCSYEKRSNRKRIV